MRSPSPLFIAPSLAATTLRSADAFVHGTRLRRAFHPSLHPRLLPPSPPPPRGRLALLASSSLLRPGAHTLALTSPPGTLFFRVSGLPSAPPVVLLHSFLTDMTIWDQQVRALGKHFLVIRVDWRGHGGSSEVDEERKYNHTDDLRALMVALGFVRGKGESGGVGVAGGQIRAKEEKHEQEEVGVTATEEAKPKRRGRKKKSEGDASASSQIESALDGSSTSDILPSVKSSEVPPLSREELLRVPSLIGSSMGGTLALDYASRFPSDVRRVMVVSTGLHGYEWQTYDTYLDVTTLAPRGLQGLKNAWMGMKFLSYTMENSPGARAVLEGVMKRYSGWHFEREDSFEWSQPRLVERLEDVRVPVVAVVGEGDIRDYKSIAEVVSRRCAGARKVEIAEVGHYAMLERPKEFNEMAVKFLLEGVEEVVEAAKGCGEAE